MARLQEGHNNSRFVAYLSGEFGQFNLAISIHTFNAFEHTTSSIYTHGTKAPERCKHHNGKAQEAERWASGAPGSGSAADAVRRRLRAVVRLERPYASALTPGCSPCSTVHDPSQCLWASLLDHLVRKDEQVWRQRQAEGLGRLEVDDELKLRGLLHRQLPGLGALQDLVDVRGDALIDVCKHRAVRQQPPCTRHVPPPGDRRNPVLRCRL